jgi:hypothetical protein
VRIANRGTTKRQGEPDRVRPSLTELVRLRCVSRRDITKVARYEVPGIEREERVRPGCDRDDRNDFLFPTRNPPSIVPGGTRRSKTNTTPALRTGLLSFVPNGTFTPKNATPSAAAGAATFIESYRTALIADLKFAICYLSFSDERCPRFPLRYAA